jgi:hypothetical protein
VEAEGAMKRTFVCALLILAAFSLCLCKGFTTTKVVDIKDNPRDYVGKEVVVSGTVLQTYSLFVIKYFTLRDDSGEITVVTERPLPREGQHLKIRGVVKEAFAIGKESLLVIQENSEGEKQKQVER